jgi:hypothetical protein
MRILSAGLATILLGGTVLAQPRVPASQVHCESTGKGEDSIQLERLCLARLGGVATRVGADLRLKLENGTTKTFTDARQACEQQNPAKCLEYRLAAYYSIPKLFVIEQLAYESSRVIVVNGRSGSIIRMDVHPHHGVIKPKNMKCGASLRGMAMIASSSKCNCGPSAPPANARLRRSLPSSDGPMPAGR